MQLSSAPGAAWTRRRGAENRHDVSGGWCHFGGFGCEGKLDETRRSPTILPKAMGLADWPILPCAWFDTGPRCQRGLLGIS